MLVWQEVPWLGASRKRPIVEQNFDERVEIGFREPVLPRVLRMAVTKQYHLERCIQSALVIVDVVISAIVKQELGSRRRLYVAENNRVWECGKCGTPRVVKPTSINESLFDQVGWFGFCFEKNPHHADMITLRG